MSSPNSPQDLAALEAGLTALKDKDYQQAIALLEPISELEHPAQNRVKMGLVVAYERTGNVKASIQLCRVLTQSDNEKVKTWSRDYLKKLLKQNPPQLKPSESQTTSSELPPIAETGFVPLEANRQTKKAKVSHPKNSQSPVAKPANLPQPNLSKKSVQPLSDSQEVTSVKPSQVSEVNPSLFSPEPEPIQPPVIQEIQWKNAGRAATFQPLKPLKSKDLKLEQLLITAGLIWFVPIVFALINNSLHQIWIWQPLLNAWEKLSRQPWQVFIIISFFVAIGWVWQKNRLFSEMLLTILALMWLTPNLLNELMEITNNILNWLPIVNSISAFYYDSSRWVYLTLLTLFLFSPWLWDGLLKLTYGLKPFPLTTLFNLSPETNRVLRNYCQTHRLKIPELRLLPIDTPVIFSYGGWRRFARIVVSQGLLEQLTEDELAVIFAREIASIQQGDSAILFLATLISQIPYLIYWYLADLTQKFSTFNLPLPQLIKSGLQGILEAIALFLCPLCYGLYKVLRWPALELSRRRVYYSDRIACNLTGNPNGLTRALLKMTIDLSKNIQKQGEIDFILEGFSLLIPLNYQQALTWGTVAQYQGLDSLFQWDLINPYTNWLTLNQSHPLLGERLKIISFYATHWKLEPELAFTPINPSSSKKTTAYYSKLLLQGAPFFGIVGGLAIGLLLWLLGGLFYLLGWWQVEWLWGDYWILAGCIPIGCSLGLMIRTNPFFPEIKSFNLVNNPNLFDLIQNSDTIPVDSQAISVTGQLLGRTDFKNSFAQDLMLQTSTGIVKLHYIPQLTPLANFWFRLTPPHELIGQSVKITGWWRRGATPWIDVQSLETLDHRTQLAAGHPLWTSILAGIFALWGVYNVSQGGF